jgi:hypothetical protein
MKSSFLKFCVLSAVCALAVGHVSAQGTGQWATKGGAAVQNAQGTLVPAGGELAQSLSGDTVGVRVVSRPYFGATPDTWAMLSVGGATLSFAKDGNGGGIVLVGDTMQALPMRVTLDADGRAQSSLDITMTASRVTGAASVTVAGHAPAEVNAAFPTGSVPVVISAGGAMPWQLERVETISDIASMNANSANAAKNAGTASVTKAVTDTKSRAQLRREAFEGAMASYRQKDKPNAEKKLFATNRNKEGTFGWHMESAGLLVQMALSLRQQYDLRDAAELAQRALELLDAGDKLPGNPRAQDRAALFEMSGFIREELLRDEDAARLDYEKAAKLNAKSVRAKEALDRLDENRAKDRRHEGKN